MNRPSIQLKCDSPSFRASTVFDKEVKNFLKFNLCTIWAIHFIAWRYWLTSYNVVTGARNQVDLPWIYHLDGHVQLHRLNAIESLDSRLAEDNPTYVTHHNTITPQQRPSKQITKLADNFPVHTWMMNLPAQNDESLPAVESTRLKLGKSTKFTFSSMISAIANSNESPFEWTKFYQRRFVEEPRNWSVRQSGLFSELNCSWLTNRELFGLEWRSKATGFL